MAGIVVAVELFAIAWIRNRFLNIPMRSSLVFVTVGGVDQPRDRRRPRRLVIVLMAGLPAGCSACAVARRRQVRGL